MRRDGRIVAPATGTLNHTVTDMLELQFQKTTRAGLKAAGYGVW